MNIKSNLLTTKVISPLNFEMIFTIFLLVMFVKKEAYAQERVGIRGNLDESPGWSVNANHQKYREADGLGR